jgi:hypothetical protein
MLSVAVDETGTPQIEDEASLRWHRNTKQNGVAVDDAETLTAASENAAESHKDVLTVREPFVPRRTDYHELVTITVVVDGTLTEYDPTAPPATEHASKTADQRSDAHGERPGLQSPPASQSPTEHEDRHCTRQRDEPDARFSTTSTNGEGTTTPPATTIQALTQPSQVHLLPHSAWHGRSD